MKTITLVIVLTLSFIETSLAGDVFVKSKKLSLDIALFEKLVTLHTFKDSGATIKLVQVSNGGASDMSAYLAPSTLYFTVFVKGEERDLTASYKILEDVVKVIDARYIKARNLIRLKTSHRKLKNEGRGPIVKLKMKSLIDISLLKKEINSDNLYNLEKIKEPIKLIK